MDPVVSGLSAGGIGGVIVAVVFILYKCCQNKKLHSKCCGGELDVSEDKGSPRVPPPTPSGTPQLKPIHAERKISDIDVIV